MDASVYTQITHGQYVINNSDDLKLMEHHAIHATQYIVKKPKVLRSSDKSNTQLATQKVVKENIILTLSGQKASNLLPSGPHRHKLEDFHDL